MRPLRRRDEPAVLAENRAAWTDDFLGKHAANPRARPDRRRYGHRQVLDELAAMSSNKCFYCEQPVDERREVDHYIEVAEAPERAFEWANLYLSCFECNRKKAANRQRPAAECVDPCEPTVDPADHLTFDDELIRARDASPRGLATIQKYRLARDDLNYKRVVQIKHFMRALDRIRQVHEVESRGAMSDAEVALLRSFAAPDHAFSLMFEVLLARLGLR